MSIKSVPILGPSCAHSVQSAHARFTRAIHSRCRLAAPRLASPSSAHPPTVRQHVMHNHSRRKASQLRRLHHHRPRRRFRFGPLRSQAFHRGRAGRSAPSLPQRAEPRQHRPPGQSLPLQHRAERAAQPRRARRSGRQRAQCGHERHRNHRGQRTSTRRRPHGQAGGGRYARRHWRRGHHHLGAAIHHHRPRRRQAFRRTTGTVRHL